MWPVAPAISCGTASRTARRTVSGFVLSRETDRPKRTSAAIIGGLRGAPPFLIPRPLKNTTISKERAMNNRPTFTSRFEIDDESRIVVVSLAGDFDPSAVEELHPQIQELVRAGYRRYVFDLAALDHLGSIALRLLVALAKQVRGEGAVALSGLHGRIETLISMTSVDRILTSYSTRDLATAALRNRDFRRPPVGLVGSWPLTSRFASSRRRRPHRP